MNAFVLFDAQVLGPCQRICKFVGAPEELPK